MRKKIFILSLFMLFILPVFLIKTVFAQTTSQNTSFYVRNLYYGMKNNTDTANLQKFLKDLGYFSGPTNGNFGPLTLAAVKKFQSGNKVISTGYWGPLTRAIAKNINTAPVQLQQSLKQITPAVTTTTPSSTGASPAPATTSPLFITTTSLPSATAGTPYSVDILSSGGTGSYSWWVSAGLLPPGLSLVPTRCIGPSCPSNATIFGNPVTAWTYNFAVTVTSGTQVVSQAFTLTINPSIANLKISPTVPSTFNAGQTFETQALYTPAPNCYQTDPCGLPDTTAVKVTWTPSNNAVATVAYKYYDSTTGVITAVSPGTATITANYIIGNINLTATITVFVAGTIGARLQITPTAPSVSVGKTTSLQAVYYLPTVCSSGSCASGGSSTIQVTWTSSNNAVATVAYKSDDPKTAIVTGISPGVTTITAVMGYNPTVGSGLTATTGLIVTPAQ